jgi:hypothetical protein
MDGFPLTRMCRLIQIRKSSRIRKSRKIKVQPLCGEYPSWVLYLFFKEEDYGSFFCMILD